MIDDAYQYQNYEDSHWWFLARRQILKKILDTYVITAKKSNHAILELGTASGGNL
tara:strand:- start:521 stop:685 length:165 start_codon:yes stop_codon:yes gene_type:complete